MIAVASKDNKGVKVTSLGEGGSDKQCGTARFTYQRLHTNYAFFVPVRRGEAEVGNTCREQHLDY